MSPQTIISNFIQCLLRLTEMKEKHQFSCDTDSFFLLSEKVLAFQKCALNFCQCFQKDEAHCVSTFN